MSSSGWKYLLMVPLFVFAFLAFVSSGSVEPDAALEPLVSAAPGTSLSGFTDSPGEDMPTYSEGRILLRLAQPLAGGAGRVDPLNTGNGEIDELNRIHGITSVELLADFSSAEPVYIYRFDFPDGVPVEQLAADYSLSPLVAYAEPDYDVAAAVAAPDDPYYSSSGTWGQGYDDLWGLKKIDALGAWQVETGDPGTVVAVLDTGLDFSHVDIQGNIWNNAGETGLDGSGQDKKTNGVDDDANGYVDDWRGWDYYNEDNDPTDDHGHGTHVSGTISATTDNATGVAGVSWRAQIMPLKFLGRSGSGSISGAVSAIRYAADNGAVISSNSWGGGGWSQTLADAFEFAHSGGMTHIAAAGNSGADCSNYQPAAFPTVITVAATQHNDARAYFSNYGPKIDVAAPGVDTLSLRASGTSMGSPVGSLYTRASGTSMATPHVAGLAVLIHSEHPGWTNEQIRQVIRSSADDIGTPGRDDYYGYGRINAATAMSLGEPPVALLTGPLGTVNGEVDITGTAGGNGFQGFLLEYATAAAPDNWTELATGTTPKNNETIYQGFDTSQVPDGSLSFKLTVTSDTGQAYETIAPVVDNVYLTSPTAGTLSRTPTEIDVAGRANATGFTSFEVLHGEGENPSSWSSAGVTLIGGGAAPVDGGMLATWDTTAVSTAGLHTVKLVTHIGGREESEQVSVYLDPDIHEGWPQQIDVSSRLSLLDTPTVADIDGDGAMETLYSYYDKIYVVRADGTPQPGWPKTAQYMRSGQRSPAVGNIDDDAELEIIFNDGAYTFAWNHDGSVVPGWPVYCNTYTMPVVADIENDGANEVVIVGIYKTTSGIRIVDGDGSVRPGWPVATPSYWQSQPAVGDIDGDGIKEIVFAGSSGLTYAYDDDGTLVAGWPAATHNSTPWSYPSLADLDGDRSMEVVIGSDQKKVHALDGDGTTLAGWPQSTAGAVQSTPAIGDIDNDGALEIIAGCDRYGSLSTRRLYAWEADGTLIDGWPVTAGSTNHTFYGYGSPALADIDADGTAEIVVDNDTRYLNAYESDGTVAAGFPRYTGEIGAFMSNVPAVGDIDGDGSLEVVAANYGKSFIMWDIDAAAAVGDEWPGFRHDPGHTAAYPTAAGIVSDEHSTVVVDRQQVEPGGTIQVTVTLRDDFDIPVTGKDVTLAAAGGAATLVQPGTPTDAAGEAAGSISAPDGVRTVTASIEGMELSDSATVVFSGDTEDPQVSVHAPAGGEFWMGGTVHDIYWTASDNVALADSPVTIEYSADGGLSWSLVAAGEENDGSYAWTVPAIDSSAVLVRVSASDTSLRSGSGLSAAVLTIDSQVPRVTAASPAAGTAHVPVDTAVTVQFDEAIDPATVMASNLTLRRSADGAPVAAATGYDPATRTATLTPRAGLEEGTGYTAGLCDGITDLAGNPVASLEWSFTTAWGEGRAYYFTWYDSNRFNGMDGDWILVNNNGDATAIVTISIAGKLKGTYRIAPGEEVTPQFHNTTGGPVKVVSVNDQPLMVSQRVIYNGSFNEIFAVPRASLESTYYFTWYDSYKANMMNGNWILMANTGDTASMTEVYIGGQLAGRYNIPAGGHIAPQFPNRMGGPVKVVSTNGQSLLVSQRVIFRDSFNEVMGYPESRVTDTYYFTWYDSKRANYMNGNWILAANLGSSPALVEVYIAGTLKGIYSIPAGGMITPLYHETMGGPVKVVSTNGQPLIVSQRTLFKQSFEEVQGVPPAGLGTRFGFPWYDSRFENGMGGNWILIGNHGTAPAGASIYLDGRKMDDIYRSGRPWQVPVGGRAVAYFPYTMGGPVDVVGLNGQPLIVSQRVIYKDSFNELVGLLPDQ